MGKAKSVGLVLFLITLFLTVGVASSLTGRSPKLMGGHAGLSCMDCHGKGMPKRLVRPDVCKSCHEDVWVSVGEGPHNAKVNPEFFNITAKLGGRTFRLVNCTVCHNPHRTSFWFYSNLTDVEDTSDLCGQCHV